MRAVLRVSVILYVLLFLLVGGSTSVQAQSTLNLPRLVEQGGRFTGIAIANPSN